MGGMMGLSSMASQSMASETTARPITADQYDKIVYILNTPHERPAQARTEDATERLERLLKEGEQYAIEQRKIAEQKQLQEQIARTQAEFAAKAREAASLYRNGESIFKISAERTGIPADYLQRIAGKESGGNVYAQNTRTSAGGIAQFTDGTMKLMINKYADKYGYDEYEGRVRAAKRDPLFAVLMTGELTWENLEYMSDKLRKKRFNYTEGSIGHFLGADGAVDFLKAYYCPKKRHDLARNHVSDAAYIKNQDTFKDRHGRQRTVEQVYAMKARVMTEKLLPSPETRMAAKLGPLHFASFNLR